MKKAFLLLFSIVLLSGCGKEENSLVGKYMSIKDSDNYIEIYEDSKCYYKPYSSANTHDCNYVKSNNSIRIEYSYYDVIKERETTDSITFEIQDSNLKYNDTIFYKQ